MAIFHAECKIISRSKGQSSVASAAYRAGVRLRDERLGEVFDYRRKSGIDATKIMMPDGAIQWSREELWNLVERDGKRKDSQLAREWEFALPVELSPHQNMKLACDFVREHFVQDGVCVDIAFHKLNSHNPHFHMMSTITRVGPEGFLPRKDHRDLNNRDRVELIRSAWSAAVNELLTQNGHSARIDHRSYKRQANDKEPTLHLGPACSGMERRGVATLLGNHNRQVYARSIVSAALDERRPRAERAGFAAIVERLLELAGKLPLIGRGARQERQRLSALAQHESELERKRQTTPRRRQNHRLRGPGAHTRQQRLRPK